MKSILFCVLSILYATVALAQTNIATSNATNDFPLKKVLNASYTSSSFNNIKKKITIVDFFGTWCIPCIKALPHLAEVQQKYADQVQIILVSVEEEEKLKTFIARRKNFSFPLAVDGDNSLTNLFQPPSYPFTVILNEEGKVLAQLTDAAQLTDDAINNWLTDGQETATDVSKNTSPSNSVVNNNLEKTNNAVVQLSQDFLYAAKTGEPVSSFEESLKKLDFAALQQALKTENEKKAFWINLYNAYSNSILKKNPEKYTNRNKFFKAKQIEVAGKMLSLDEIEHDFLRRTKIKWSLGYLNKLFPSKTAKALRVDEVDYRIHFALNCGAKSCPPIAFYNPEKLDQQLNLATKAYLGSEAEYNPKEAVIYLPAIMSWFRADFGGKKGMRAILKKHNIIPADADTKIKFKKYDWSLELNNYKTE